MWFKCLLMSLKYKNNKKNLIYLYLDKHFYEVKAFFFDFIFLFSIKKLKIFNTSKNLKNLVSCVCFFIIKFNEHIENWNVIIIFGYFYALGGLKFFFSYFWLYICKPFKMYKKYWYDDVLLSYDYANFYFWTRWGPWTWSIPYLRVYLTFLFIKKFCLTFDNFLTTPKKNFIVIIYEKIKQKKMFFFFYFLKTLFLFFLLYFFFPNIAKNLLLLFITSPKYILYSLPQITFAYQYMQECFWIFVQWLNESIQSQGHFSIVIFLFFIWVYYKIKKTSFYDKYADFLCRFKFFKKYFFLLLLYLLFEYIQYISDFDLKNIIIPLILNLQPYFQTFLYLTILCYFLFLFHNKN